MITIIKINSDKKFRTKKTMELKSTNYQIIKASNHQISKSTNLQINKIVFIFYFLIFVFLFSSCKKTDTFISPAIADYFPLQSGKYITYHLDSIVYKSFGTRDTTISYEVKYLTDSLTTDNLGRPAWRIFRFIRKESSQPWIPDASFMAINTGTRLEFIENNLRYVKLQLPIQNDFSWKGNSFIDTYSAYSQVRYLDNWDYVYANVDGPDNVGTYTLDSTLTVNQRDEVIGLPDQPDSYSEKNFSQEKYARGIGMIYRKFFHSEYQPSNGGYFADGSYGVTYTMIDHN